MRAALLTTVAFVYLTSAALAQSPASFPPGAEGREASLMARVGPLTRAWIHEEALRETNLREADDGMAARAVRDNGHLLGRLNHADVEAVAFLVMMQAARSAQEDVKAMASHVKQLRDAQAAVQASTSRRDATTARAGTGPSTAPGGSAGPPAIDRTAITPRPRPQREFDAQLGLVRHNPEALSALGEMESLRLQMAMDRLSKMMATLSNLLKKTSETASGLTRNLK